MRTNSGSVVKNGVWVRGRRLARDEAGSNSARLRPAGGSVVAVKQAQRPTKSTGGRRREEGDKASAELRRPPLYRHARVVSTKHAARCEGCTCVCGRRVFMQHRPIVRFVQPRSIRRALLRTKMPRITGLHTKPSLPSTRRGSASHTQRDIRARSDVHKYNPRRPAVPGPPTFISASASWRPASQGKSDRHCTFIFDRSCFAKGTPSPRRCLATGSWFQLRAARAVKI